MQDIMRHAGTATLALCLLALLGLAGALDGYSHLEHPVGLPGAAGMPAAATFNVLVFVLPGAMAAVLAVRLRGRLPAGASPLAGIGCWMLALSGLAFAAQGLLPLDANQLDSPASQRHATAWPLWWVAFVPASAALALGLLRCADWRGFALTQAMLGAVVLLMVLAPTPWWPAPVSQRVALVAWLLAVALAGRR